MTKKELEIKVVELENKIKLIGETPVNPFPISPSALATTSKSQYADKLYNRTTKTYQSADEISDGGVDIPTFSSPDNTIDVSQTTEDVYLGITSSQQLTGQNIFNKLSPSETIMNVWNPDNDRVSSNIVDESINETKLTQELQDKINTSNTNITTDSNLFATKSGNGYNLGLNESQVLNATNLIANTTPSNNISAQFDEGKVSYYVMVNSITEDRLEQPLIEKINLGANFNLKNIYNPIDGTGSYHNIIEKSFSENGIYTGRCNTFINSAFPLEDFYGDTYLNLSRFYCSGIFSCAIENVYFINLQYNSYYIIDVSKCSGLNRFELQSSESAKVLILPNKRISSLNFLGSSKLSEIYLNLMEGDQYIAVSTSISQVLNVHLKAGSTAKIVANGYTGTINYFYDYE